MFWQQLLLTFKLALIRVPGFTVASTVQLGFQSSNLFLLLFLKETDFIFFAKLWINSAELITTVLWCNAVKVC